MLRAVVLALPIALLSACGTPRAASNPQSQASAPASVSASASAQASSPAYDAELTNYTYPYPVKFHALRTQSQDLRMAYMEIAPTAPPNGKTVLLLHGKNFSGAYWHRTIEALVAKGFRVVVPDQIGFGKSSKPHTYQFTFQQLARNTASLLDALNVAHVEVVGHSMGGMLAARFALMFPERTTRLSLVNPIGLEDWKTMTAYRSVDDQYAAELKSTTDSIREYQKQAYFAGTWKPEYEPLIDILAGWTRHPDYPKVAWNAALTADMIFTQPVLYEFPQIKAPTLLIIGTRDATAIGKAWAKPEVARTMGNYDVLGERAAAAIPNSTLVEIPGVGHMPQIEAFPQYIDALTSFLAK